METIGYPSSAWRAKLACIHADPSGAVGGWVTQPPTRPIGRAKETLVDEIHNDTATT